MIGNIKNFRFWCQKVIPLVYDNSLSYYEVLCKVVHYLNHVIDDINNIPEYIDEKVKEAFDEDHIKELIMEVFQTLEDAISNNNEGQNTNFSKDYPDLGTLLWHDNKLYETIRVIDEGDAIIENVNIKLVNFGDMFNDFIDEVKENFTEFDDGKRETSSMDRPIHQLVWLDDVLYEVIKPIAEGNAYIYNGDNKNVEPITMDYMYQYILSLIANEAETRANEDNRITLEMTDLIASRVNAEANTRAEEDVRITLELTDLISSRVNAEAELRTEADNNLQNQINDLSDVRYLFNNVNDMKAAEYLKAGDTVYCAGYYAAGDGGYGTFKIAPSAIGFSHLLDTGLYATNVDDDFVLPRYGGYYVNVMLDNARPFMMPHQYKHIILPEANGKHPGCGTYTDADGIHYFWQVTAPIIYDEHLAYSVNDFYGEITLTADTTNREAIIKISDERKPEDITFTGKLQIGGYHFNNVMNYASNGILIEGCGRVHFNDVLIAWCVNCLTMGGAGVMNPIQTYFHYLEVGSCTNAGIIASTPADIDSVIFNVDYLSFQNALETCKYGIYVSSVPFNWYIGDFQCVATSKATNFVPIRMVQLRAQAKEHALYIGSARLQATNELGIMVGIYGAHLNAYIGNLVCAQLGGETCRIINSSTGQLIINNLDARAYPFILQTDTSNGGTMSVDNITGGEGTIIGNVKLNGIITGNADLFNSALIVDTNTGNITAKYNGTTY